MSIFTPLTPEQRAAEHTEAQAALAALRAVLDRHPQAVKALDDLVAKKAEIK